jgi:hypothetical protein
LYTVNNGDLSAAVKTKPANLTMPSQMQGEAITFAPSGSEFVLSSEGQYAPTLATTDPALTLAQPPAATAPALSVGTQFHGLWAEMSDADRERNLDMIAESGAGWVRIDISWSMIQPTGRGVYHTQWGVPFVEKILNMAHERNLKVLGTFWLTPEWASGSTNKRVLPKDPADYAAALKWASNRWQKQVQAWEVWNEPNLSAYLSPPDPVGYTKLLKAAYPAMKAGNPDAQLLAMSTMYVDTDWIGQAYAAGAKGNFDVVSVHPYQGYASAPPADPAEGRIQRMTHTAELISLMQAQGDGHKKIWFTEFGWSAHENTASTDVWMLGVSEATQAQYLKWSLSMIQGRWPQVTHAFWYNSRDTATGKVHADNRGLIRRDFTARPALREITCFTKGC